MLASFVGSVTNNAFEIIGEERMKLMDIYGTHIV